MSLYDDAVELEKLRTFVESIARLVKDGEPGNDGDEYDMTSDDAVDTLHSLISEARAIVGLPADGIEVDDDTRSNGPRKVG